MVIENKVALGNDPFGHVSQSLQRPSLISHTGQSVSRASPAAAIHKKERATRIWAEPLLGALPLFFIPIEADLPLETLQKFPRPVFSYMFAMIRQAAIICQRSENGFCRIIRDKKMYTCKAAPIGIVLSTVLLLLPLAFSAETWSLGQTEDWQAVSQSPRGKYLLAVSELKKIVSGGDVKQLKPAVAKLKEDFPEIAGLDLDDFVKAEKYYAAGKFTKAVRAYDTFLARYPESPLYEAALDREFSIAQAYLSGHKKTVLKFVKLKGYAEGAKVADKIIERAGDSPMAVRASLAVVESYEKRARYQEAYDRWSQISSRWPTGKVGENALLAMARCKHAAYRGPKYDVSDLVSAKSYYENFQTRYPEDAKMYEVDKRIEQITEQIAYKEYLIAKYYDRTGSKNAARIYCDTILEQWPESTGAKGAKYIIEDNKQAQIEQAETIQEKK